MFEELIIWGPQVADEHDTLAELSEKDRAFLAILCEFTSWFERTGGGFTPIC